MRRLFVNISLAILLLAVLPGCRRRPLEDPDYRTLVKVKVDISGISNVTCDIYNDKIPVPKIVPEAMHLMLFGEDASSTAAEAFITDVATGADGSRTISGELVVAPGTYRLLAYDFGTEATFGTRRKPTRNRRRRASRTVSAPEAGSRSTSSKSLTILWLPQARGK